MEITNSKGVTISCDTVEGSHHAITIRWSLSPNDCASFIVDDKDQLCDLIENINSLIVIFRFKP